MSGVPNDTEVRRLTKLIGRKTNILDNMFSGNKDEYVIKEREVGRSRGHHLNLSDIHDYFRTLLEHIGYDVRPNNGLTKTSKEVRISGEAYKRAKVAYELFRD